MLEIPFVKIFYNFTSQQIEIDPTNDKIYALFEIKDNQSQND